MKKIIENSKKVIKENTTITWQEVEKKKIELESKAQLFASTIRWSSNPSFKL